eukprot:gene27979-34589_t
MFKKRLIGYRNVVLATIIVACISLSISVVFGLIFATPADNDDNHDQDFDESDFAPTREQNFTASALTLGKSSRESLSGADMNCTELIMAVPSKNRGSVETAAMNWCLQRYQRALTFDEQNECICNTCDVLPSASTSREEWIWSPGTTNTPSCTSPAVDSAVPRMCADDPSSVALTAVRTPLCAYADTSSCKYNMRDFVQLDATLDMLDCSGTWSAPLWTIPDVWNGTGGSGNSGEVDLVEQCPTDR